MKFKSLALVLAMTVCITQNASYASSLPSTQAVKPDNLMSEITRQPVQYTSLLELADRSALAPMTADQLASITGGEDINRLGILTYNQMFILIIGWVSYQAGNLSLKQVLDWSGIHHPLLVASDVLVCDAIGGLLPAAMRQSQLSGAKSPARDFDTIDGLYGVAGGLLAALGAGGCKMTAKQTQVKWDEETIKKDKEIVAAVNANVTNTPNGRRLATIGKQANQFLDWYSDDLTTNNYNASWSAQEKIFWGKQFDVCKNSGRPYFSCIGYLDKYQSAAAEFIKHSNWAQGNFHALVYKSGEWYNALGLKMPPAPTVGGRRMGPKVYPIFNDPDINNPNAHR